MALVFLSLHAGIIITIYGYEYNILISMGCCDNTMHGKHGVSN